MWWVFPQVAGLGMSPTSQAYAVRDLAEARAYLAHDVLEPRLRECGDAGTPIVLAEPESASAKALREVAEKLTVRSRGLAGMSLNISPVRR